MKKILLLMIVLVLGNSLVSAQLRKFRWNTDSCSFEGTYDAKKYTAAQLKNTFDLYYSQQFEMFGTNATAFKYEDVEKFSTLEAIDAEYQKKSAALQKLDIVKTPDWNAYKQLKIKALDEAYQLTRVSVQAYRKPTALRELTFADECVERFANPLINGGDELLNVWRGIIEERIKRNGDAERHRREFETELASADKFKYAQVEVTTFGWWNCVNQKIDRGPYDDVLEKSFHKLFTRVRTFNCEEP